MAEYGLIIGLVALITIVAITKFGAKNKCAVCLPSRCLENPNFGPCRNETSKKNFLAMCERNPNSALIKNVCRWK